MFLAVIFKTATVMNQEYAQEPLPLAFEVPEKALNSLNNDDFLFLT